MKKVRVKARASVRKNSIRKLDENYYLVCVTEAPEKGKANEAIQKMLARELNIAYTKITLLKGHKSRDKLFVINA
ncbi:MAG: UPF0235 protein [Chitinophagales bacterium]|nr:MAG: UPF0235 protein [Chitinophagales bacterium]